MKIKTYLLASGTLFAIVGLFHLLRVLLNWSLIVERVDIPVWVSILAVLVIWFLSFNAFRLHKNTK